MLVCKKCHSPVSISGAIVRIVSGIVIKRNGIEPSGEATVFSTESTSDFFCQECSTKLSSEEIAIMCCNCGEIKSLENSVRTDRTGLVVCQDCYNEFFSDEPKRSVTDIIGRR